MNKKILLLGTISLLMLSGCNANKQQPNNQQNTQQTEQVATQEENTTQMQEVSNNEKEETITKAKEVQDPSANIPFTYYRVIPSQIEVFSYRGLNNSTIIDDTKLNDSFYLKGNYIRIEKILESKLGDKYGKIAGKGLLVSMDDLEIKQ